MSRSQTMRAERVLRRVALVAAALLVLSLPAAPATVAQQPDGGPARIDVDALREEYEELVGEEADLLLQYDLAGQRVVDLLPRVQAAEAAVTRADRAVVTAQLDLADRQDEEADAEREAEAAARRVKAAEERLRTYAIETYMDSGDSDAMGAVFTIIEGDDSSLARRGYRQSVDDQQRDLIDALVTARADGRVARSRARRLANDAEEQRAQVDVLRGQAATALDESARLVAEAASERDRQQLLLVEVQSRKVSIEARITSLEKAADGIEALLAAYQGDEEDWVAGAVDVRMPRVGGVISSEFGMRSHPILATTRLHAGADIGGPAGASVLAAADGIVVAAEVRGGYGNTVVLAHGYSLSTVYAHNQSLVVNVGDLVEQGDEIAKLGSTGLSTGPHIHLETRIKGTPVNPRSILNPEGDATYGKGDDDGDGLRNGLDPEPDDPNRPVPNGRGDDDGDGVPNGGDLAPKDPNRR